MKILNGWNRLLPRESQYVGWRFWNSSLEILIENEGYAKAFVPTSDFSYLDLPRFFEESPSELCEVYLGRETSKGAQRYTDVMNLRIWHG